MSSLDLRRRADQIARGMISAQGANVIRLGIVGCNYGHSVLLPAFRLDRRCQVTAIAGTDAARTMALARNSEIPNGYADWRTLIDSTAVDAVAIAAPPRLQPDIAVAALQSGKPVFAEKPMAADLAGAMAMTRAINRQVTAIDYNFTEVPAWRTAKAMIDDGAIGRLRQLFVNWSVENETTRRRLRTWKSAGDTGGGALGNFVSHTAHYVEWFAGPVESLSAQVAGLADDPAFETTVIVALTFASGAAGSIAMSCAAFRGSGHRLEFYGDDGMLVLANTTPDYMRGFSLHHARRPAATLAPVAIDDDPLDRFSDGRIAPAARLAARFLDAIEQRRPMSPGFAEGYRAQVLLDAMRCSHVDARRIEIPEAAT
jgi:predicted dehydrogenase